MSRPGAAVVTWLAVSSCLAGCSSDPHSGYSFSPAHDTGIATVHVPMFQNNTFSRGLEVELTDAIIKEIQKSTPWRTTAEPAAQATLTGTIVSSELRPLSYARTSGLVQEEAVVLTIEFDFKDNRTGKVLVSRRGFTASDSFVPSRVVGERIEVGLNGAIQKLARDVVAELRAAW